MVDQVTVKPGTELFGAIRRMVTGNRLQTATRNTAELSVRELYEAIHEAYVEWRNALMNFENADCKDMVDYYAYRIKASQIRYEYLLRKAKAMQQVP